MAVIIIDQKHTHLFPKNQLAILEKSLTQVCHEYSNRRITLRVTWTCDGFIIEGYRENASQELLSIFGEQVCLEIAQFL